MRATCVQLALVIAASHHVAARYSNTSSPVLPHGMWLAKVPITQGDTILAEVWLREGNEFAEQIGSICHQLSEGAVLEWLEVAQCQRELVPKIKLKYNQERARRLAVISELTRDEALWAHDLAVALETDSTVALRLMLNSVRQE